MTSLVLGHFSPWTFQSYDRSANQLRSSVTSALYRFGPEDRSDTASSVHDIVRLVVIVDSRQVAIRAEKGIQASYL